eukprot:NODE_5402_length_659_cov_14.943609_g5239_i0.p1 GENE.NODE_5402_length_659_cov_14.943609_g5239_i0~~NODE_5402_length_659_cov_14.943609_g5239_i0.p1  ORF type:complete len:210 (+),score=64.94 NODE_5402_length_659_cov_14.943609_g5239_i0:71-631(+)
MLSGGALVATAPALVQRCKFVQNMHGSIMVPGDAFLMLQTVKTLALRVRHQSRTADTIARWLQTHPAVEYVCYPGLATFPQRELADKQHRDNLHGSMVWFDVKGGDQSAIRLMNTIPHPWSLCENLGACESIITACAVMTHANMLPADRRRAGVGDGFIRLSCGVEEVTDLIDALRTALDAVAKSD